MSLDKKITLIASQNESEIDIFSDSQAKQSIIDLISGAAPFSGEFFFSALAEHLAKILGIKYVIVAEISEWSDTDPIAVKTLSFWDKDEIGDNFEYQF